ncbi:MAG: RnfABCDGE type electron transport complex subunit G [Clostridia bacterium]|nr:RnfABCDGE type electron transport complex subunit G [Clostridia bacterium]
MKKAKKEKIKQQQEVSSQPGVPHHADHKKNAKVALVLACITILSGLVLGYFYQLTKEPIAQQTLKREQQAYLSVFPEADQFDPIAWSGTEEGGVTVDKLYSAKKGTEDLGTVVCVTSHEGYGGDISLVVGVAQDGTTTGISFLSISETAGLGMNAQKPSFMDQFANKKVDTFQVIKGESTQDNEISAISGATVTSRAVTSAVNAALTAAEQGGAK